MKNKIFVTISFVLFAFCFAVFYVGLQKPNIYTPKLDKQIELPNFVGNDFFSGEMIISDNLFKNNSFYIINIWASWCIPCRAEHSFLMALNNKNLNLLGINYKDNISNAQSFLNELGNPYSKILSDKNGVTSIELGAYGVPETFIVNKEKKIIKKIIGPIDNEKFNEILELIN